MRRWKQGLASILAVLMLVSALPATALAAEEGQEDPVLTQETEAPAEEVSAEETSTEEVVYNLLDCPVTVGSDEARMGEYAYALFDEQGNYTIALEDNAFFPYEVQFTYGGETWTEWFMDPADTVDVGGHVFSVVSEQTDPSVLTQIGVTVGGEYIPAYPEEKTFSDMPSISTMSLLPLEEKWFTVDMKGFFAEELKKVAVTAVLEKDNVSLKENDLVVWAKGYNSDDYAIMDRTGTLDLSPASSYDSSVYFDLIVGNADRQTPHPIIYRDMKPSNIMLQPDGTLKLIDFGIARAYKQESGGDTACIGTKGYAAPEQFGTAQTDARTDIYSLGVTMYHILTGKSPYAPPYGFVPARQLIPSLSCGIEHILMKCVQPEPEARYQNVAELVDDLHHRYRYDQAYRKYVAARRAKTALILGLLMASAALIISGRVVMGRERERQYAELLFHAGTFPETAFDQAETVLDQARSLFPERVDADRKEAYILYENGQWQACVDCGTAAIAQYGEDPQTRLILASAQFELGEYKLAAENFARGGELSADNLRDYAVCLGRLGQVDQAEQVLAGLNGQGTYPDVTEYVQGEVSYARQDYLAAESAFLDVLDKTDTPALVRRCYRSLGELYRDCAALARVNASPIAHPATRSVQMLSSAVVQEGLRYDSVLWEMLAMAYFEAWHTDTSVPEDYGEKAAQCFRQVIQLGVTKEYLYANLYTIYYDLGDYDQAEQALEEYEALYPEDYMPHALRGMMCITIENQKLQSDRDYRQALEEYETAGRMLRSSDDTTYYQQLESLIQRLRDNGWL